MHVALIVTGANKWRRLKGRDRRLDRIDDVKRKMDWAMDEKQLLSRLQSTQVVFPYSYFVIYLLVTMVVAVG